jgi:hypothetical protein
VLPDFLRDSLGQKASAVFSENPAAVAKAIASKGADQSEMDAIARVLKTAADTFMNYSLVAEREFELKVELSKRPEMMAAVPLLVDDVHDLAALAQIGDRLWVS